ncbi:MAG: transcriptional regulator [Sphingomonadales bacterium]|nr:transcriptional regulator [Sphingomonadales bacterium]
MKLDKVTEKRDRWYDDACGTAHALELIGERWALLIVRELMLGGRRFGEIRASLPGISANVLTVRLAGLEQAGIVRRRALPPPASAQIYELTDWGYEAETSIQELGRWAARSPAHDATLSFSAVSLMLSLRTMHSPERVQKMNAHIGFRLGNDRFVGHLTSAGFAVERGDPEKACKKTDVIFTSTPPMMAAAIYGGVPLNTLEADGQLTIEGNRALAERFVTLFPLPTKAF